MKKLIKYIVLCCVLSCYSVGILACYIEILSHLTNSGSEKLITTASEIPQPYESKHIYTQGKYLQTIIKIEVPSEGILTTIQFPDPDSFVYPIETFGLSKLQSFKFVRYLPRDPPLV